MEKKLRYNHHSCNDSDIILKENDNGGKHGKRIYYGSSADPAQNFYAS